SGPTLRFGANAVIALAGGHVEACLDDSPIPMYQSVAVRAGQVLACGAVLTGMRCYLAVAGGFSIMQVLTSASTDTFSGLGPPMLRAGDSFAIQSQSLHEGWYLRTPPEFSDGITLRVILEPHTEWFTAAAFEGFLLSEFEVRADSDRTGLRLAGRRIVRSNQVELRSQGMVSGAVQVPGDGHPIVLLPNHGTTGGYPVIAVVIRVDLPQLGQLRSGAKVRFEAVSHEQALGALRSAEADLRHAIVPADPGLLVARSLMLLAKSHPALREASLRLGSRYVRLRH
ncbi:MAG: biotin-dependent carboxyltransferase family protein, partial [Gammaproteobacteria bacterium]